MGLARPRVSLAEGIVNVNKPAGWSSAKAVAVVRGYLGGRRCKMGHAGTLDPQAEGVLVLLAGRACHLCELLIDAGKEYEAAIRLGATSTTDDSEGTVAESAGAAAPSADRLTAALRAFVGEIRQRPPAHSALKIGGKRAYKLARRGRAVATPERTVTVHQIELLGYDWPTVRVRIDCGRGTYVRSIARDLGEALGVGGYLAELKRTRVGPFTLAGAIRPGNCRRDNVDQWLLPMVRAADHLPPAHRVTLDATQAELIGRGKTLDGRKVPGVAALLPAATLAGPIDADQPIVEPIAALDSAGQLLALCRVIGVRFQPMHVLRPVQGPMPGERPAEPDTLW